MADNKFEQPPKPNKENRETEKRSKEMSASRDVLLRLLVTINLEGGKQNVGGEFAKQEDVFRLRCYALMTAGDSEQNRAAELYAEQAKDDEGPPTEAEVKARGEIAKKVIDETRNDLIPKINELFNFLLKLVGNSPLGGEAKNLIKLDSTEHFDYRTGHGSEDGTTDLTDGKPDLPAGKEAYALSPADMDTLKEKIKNTPACTIVSSDHKGYFVAKFGNEPVVFVESGMIQQAKDDETSEDAPDVVEATASDDNPEDQKGNKTDELK